MKSLALIFSLALSSSAFASVLPFSLPQMNSNPRDTYNTADHANTVFVIENYFNECPWCNRNSSNINDLATHYKDNTRVQVIDLGIDPDDGSYQQWIQNNKPNHAVVMDQSRKVTSQLGTQGYPSTYVLDCNGKVTFSGSGFWDSGEHDDVYAAVDKALNTVCAK